MSLAPTPPSILAKMRDAVLVFCGVVLLASPSNASIAVGIYFGNVYDVGGSNLVADGTLWALVADSNNNGVFAGFSEDQRLSTTAAADTFFDVNQRINVGNTLNGNTVIAMGGFNTIDAGGDGNVYHTLELSDAYAGQSVAFYWFPGAIYTGAAGFSIAAYTGTSGGGGIGDMIGSQVGGVNTTLDDTASGGTTGMVIGGLGSVTTIGMVTTASPGGAGSTPENYLYAQSLTAIPEPGSALLGIFGGFALLFRRRRSA